MILREGFKAGLMAAEPLVMDPVDIAWGPGGKAWVVEMTDCPLGIDDKGKPGGRVNLTPGNHNLTFRSDAPIKQRFSGGCLLDLVICWNAAVSGSGSRV